MYVQQILLRQSPSQEAVAAHFLPVQLLEYGTGFQESALSLHLCHCLNAEMI